MPSSSRLAGRAQFWWRAFAEGLPALWWVIGLIALVIGGSALAYVALALHKPVLAATLFAAGVLLAMAEGAYRLHEAAVAQKAAGDEQLAAYAEQRPALSFGKAMLPAHSQRIVVSDRGGELFERSFGRVIRVPVTNAQGAGEAKQVHARLRFEAQGRPLDRQFAPPPAQGEWFSEAGPEIEIALPGNGRPRLLDVVVVLDGEYPNGHEWTIHSRAAGLVGYAISAQPFDVVVDVMGSGDGPNAPYLSDTLRIDCRQGMLRADWVSTIGNEATNWVAWNPVRPRI